MQIFRQKYGPQTIRSRKKQTWKSGSWKSWGNGV